MKTKDTKPAAPKATAKPAPVKAAVKTVVQAKVKANAAKAMKKGGY